MDVDAVWSFSAEPVSAQIEKESATNIKRTWVNNGRTRDWYSATGEGRVFLRHATEVKTIWVPYGE
jgi:aldehyde dehydrogenase (NAD+)